MSDFQAEVARIALQAAAEHGFALGGGQALVAHGVVHRPTEDIDLFTDADGGVQAASEPVAAALSNVGMAVSSMPDDTELGEMFDGFENDFAEFEVHRGDDVVRLTLARFDRHLVPVEMDLGPVLHLDDVIGSKVAAMATRAEPRDFVDVAAALKSFTRERLLALAWTSDPALTDEELRESMRALDDLPDMAFLQWVEPDRVAGMRARFVDWPR
ncbi:MAG TPA: nucleotidyl transferase AbiEii/AbiGii toxin family protein [Candidatus Limnocylindrales bacterium]